MAEQTFRSPGFFEREIDLAARRQTVSGVPGGVIGTSAKGPAFVPVTVGDFTDFVNRFGGLDPDLPAVYSVFEFLKSKRALTFMRVLGAGANQTAADRDTTRNTGTVKGAGFRIQGVEATRDRDNINAADAASDVDTIDSTDKVGMALFGGANFITATHALNQAEKSQEARESFPVFVDNASITSATTTQLVRGVVYTASGHRLTCMDTGSTYTATSAKIATDVKATVTLSEFRLVIADESGAVIKNTKASLDPAHPSYIKKVLNTNPHNFEKEKHLLYLDLPVEDELASATSVFVTTGANISVSDVALSGTDAKIHDVFGRLDSRYTTAKTPSIISQPFGTQEFDLMHFESLSDGEAGNLDVKISIANLKASLDPKQPYGTFEVQVRKLRDLDTDPEIIESYPGCTLDPNAENFIARVIGDYKAVFNFDADLEEERRLIVSGKYPNRSLHVRVVMSEKYERGECPSEALPFGFRGIPVLKTSESLTDNALTSLTVGGAAIGKVAINQAALNSAATVGNAAFGDTTRVHSIGLKDFEDRASATLNSPIFPPMPFRYKVTRGQMPLASSIGGSDPSGNPALTEKVDSKLYWGMKSEKLPSSGSVAYPARNPNAGAMFNELIHGYTKFQGLAKTGALLTGSAVDAFNSNKFTLARVALNKVGSNVQTNIAEYVTGSAKEHMLEAVYMRNQELDNTNYSVTDGTYGSRVTMATLLASSSVKFNRFTVYNKFTLPLFGGFDGLNPLDKDISLMNDRSTSSDAPTGFFGKASNEFDAAFTSQTGLNAGKPGVGQKNSTVISYRQAVSIMTDPLAVRHNILAIPGIRDSFVTDFASEKVREYSLALYLMDIPAYSENSTRLFGTENRTEFSKLEKSVPDVRETSEQLSSRVIDNNYTAAYFPDVILADNANSTQVKLPASVAAMKALAFNDSVSFPWFAPAGFNRGALDNVSSVDIRLTAGDRDELYDARINPIANFPNGGFVIFGQKTLQMAQSALDRVNVRRLLLEIKRLITGIAQRLLFEPNNAETRARFINLVTPLLTTVQAQAGIDSFKVVMDDTNNSPEDVEGNRLNGRIVVVPTRAIEFIAIDFVITNSGVSFE